MCQITPSKHLHYRGPKRRREKGAENLHEETIADNIQVQEAQSLKQDEPKESTPLHVMIKMSKRKDKKVKFLTQNYAIKSSESKHENLH